MRRPQVTCHTSGNWQPSTDDHPFLCSTPARTSLLPTPIALKELDASPESTQSTFMRAQNLSSMHPTIALLLCIHLCEKLDEFLEQEIIVPVTEPTNWVSSLTYSWKANGKLWVCLDPKDLNAAIHCDHYHTPTLDEITHELGGSTCFMKLDGTSSYLCVVLSYESSLLMMFNTPWDITDSSLSPEALLVAQDIFQWIMDQILECCKGVIGIADDVIIHGHDDIEHDQCLHTLMHVTREDGLVFNGEKCAVKQPSIKFFNWIYDEDDTHLDPSQGCYHSQHAGPRDTLSTAEVPWHGHIPVSLCALSILLYSTPPWPAKEGC